MPCSRFSLIRSARGAALPAAVLGALFWAGKARAYCREVTAYPPSGYDPVTAGCFQTLPEGGALFPLFWRNQCVSYSFQTQGSQYISTSDATRLAAQAFAAWSDAPCPGGSPSITAVAFPPVDCDGAQGSQEHSNLIIFRDAAWPHDDAANVIGYTTLTVNLATGEILGANIEINSHDFTIVADLADASAPRPGTSMTVDVGTILTHEAGHFLGLAHSGDPNAVMFAHYKPGSTALAPDDVSGICSVYGPDGTHATSKGPIASTTCEPTPREGFLPNACGSIDAGVASFVGSGSAADLGSTNSPPCPPFSACATSGAMNGATGETAARAAAATSVGALLVLGALGRRARRRRSSR